MLVYMECLEVNDQHANVRHANVRTNQWLYEISGESHFMLQSHRHNLCSLATKTCCLLCSYKGLTD
jgi:hypothetical protein